MTRLPAVPRVLAALVVSLLAAGLLAVVSASSAEAAPRPPFSVTIKINQARGEVGKPLTVTGTVRPAKRGLPVTLQKRVNDGNWAVEARGTLSATGTYRFVTRPSVAGVRRFRVVVAATPTRRQTISRVVTTQVYRWIDLTKFPVRTNSYTYAQTATINSVTYGNSYVGYRAYQGGLVDWNFSRQCLYLQGRMGNSDQSDALATANINLTKDGTSFYNKTFGLTESEVRTFNVAGAFRVAFTWTSTNPDGTPENQSGASPVLAAGRVYCAR